MSKLEKVFLSLLKEEEDVDALNADSQDDNEAFTRSLDDPSNKKELEQVPDVGVDYQMELKTLKNWVSTIETFKNFLNGGENSVLGKLKEENKIGTLFDDISNATKSEVLDIAERLAALNEQLKNMYTEKYK